eukprot:267213_1
MGIASLRPILVKETVNYRCFLTTFAIHSTSLHSNSLARSLLNIIHHHTTDMYIHVRCLHYDIYCTLHVVHLLLVYYFPIAKCSAVPPRYSSCGVVWCGVV